MIKCKQISYFTGAAPEAYCEEEFYEWEETLGGRPANGQ